MSLIDRGLNILHRVQSTAQKTVDRAQNTVGNAVDAVRNTVEKGGDRVGQFVDSFEAQAVSKAQAVRGLFGGDSPDKVHDGKFVGAGGQTFPPGTPLSSIPGVTPRNNPNPTETILYVNGISDTKDKQAGSLQHIADATGAKLVGVHNATEGMVKDLAQSVKDKLDKGTNPAVDTMADTIYSELKAGRSIHVMGHSQGGLILSRALNDVSRRLRSEDGLSQADAEKLLGRVNVETFGGAAGRYPDGPKYVHYINNQDKVPTLFGLGDGDSPLDFARHAGRDAVVRRYDHGSGFDGTHTLTTAYLPYRLPFDEARAGQR
jgi:hypothetical protein